MKKIILVIIFAILCSLSAYIKASTLSVLFIGNSYTFVNNLPEMVRQIFLSDPANSKLDVMMSAKPGATLQQMWDDTNTQAIFKKQHWDFVVLQQQSEWAMFPDGIKHTATALATWNTAITDAGATPVFFATWARKEGSDWYTQIPELHDATYMQQQITYNSHTVATPLNIHIVPVGSYWIMSEKTYPSIELYAADGSHPSPAGTYLAALVFYHYFTHSSLDGVTYHPAQLSESDAQSLRKIAAAEM